MARVVAVLKSMLPNTVVDWLQYVRYRGIKVQDYEKYCEALNGKCGIEIGGPSLLFKTALPIYQVIANLDGANFAENTLWEGRIATGRNFNYLGSKKGCQFVADAVDLKQIDSKSYDFVLSSNCLEHIANPLKALEEWKRVLKDGGWIVVVVPNKQSNFDHNRSVTAFDHLLKDYREGISERDLTHLEEILALHDLRLDPPAGTMKEFEQRSRNNFANRTLHHHVFDSTLLNSALSHVGFKVIYTSSTPTDFIAMARLPC